MWQRTVQCIVADPSLLLVQDGLHAPGEHRQAPLEAEYPRGSNTPWPGGGLAYVLDDKAGSGSALVSKRADPDPPLPQLEIPALRMPNKTYVLVVFVALARSRLWEGSRQLCQGLLKVLDA
jgi:hypothetical protein